MFWLGFSRLYSSLTDTRPVLDKYNLEKYTSFSKLKQLKTRKEHSAGNEKGSETKKKSVYQNPNNYARGHTSKNNRPSKPTKASKKRYQLQIIKRAWKNTESKKQIAQPDQL